VTGHEFFCTPGPTVSHHNSDGLGDFYPLMARATKLKQTTILAGHLSQIQADAEPPVPTETVLQNPMSWL